MANKIKTSTKTFLFDPSGDTDVFDSLVSTYMQTLYDENEYTRVTVVPIDNGIMLFSETPDAKGTIEGKVLRARINPNDIAIGDIIEIESEPATVTDMSSETGELTVDFHGGDEVSVKAKKFFATDYKPVRN